MKYHLLVFLLILFGSCQEHQQTSPVKQRNTSIVELYFNGLKTNAVNAIPLTKDAVFEGPLLSESIVGDENVRQFLGAIANSFKDAELHFEEIVSENSSSCLVFNVVFPKDSLKIPVIDHIKFRNDSISYIRPYFDPRGYLELNAKD